MATQYITPDLFHDIEQGKENSKLAHRVYDKVLNYDLIMIVQDGDIYWTEKTYSFSKIPQYAYDYIKQWAKKRGLTYLYDIKTNC